MKITIKFFLLIIFFCSLFIFSYQVEAQSSFSRHNVAGSAWSPSIGYIYFSCEEQGTCSAIDYGVDINPTTGIMSGYAWSPAIGWITFNQGELSGCPSDGGASCLAKLNLSTKKFEGWARALTPFRVQFSPLPSFGNIFGGPTNIAPTPTVPLGERPIVQILIPNGDVFIQETDNVQTLGRATPSSGRTITSVRWQLNGTCADRTSGVEIPNTTRTDGLLSTIVRSTNFSGPGVNTLYLSAVDDTGQYSDCASINIVVTPRINQIVSALTPSRTNAYEFVIGEKAYVGGGHQTALAGSSLGTNDLWEYDDTSASWSRMMDFPGGPSSNSVSFSINGKGYVGLSQERIQPLSSSEYHSKLYSFEADIGGGRWSEDEEFPRPLGPTYRPMFAKSLNDKAYVAMFNSLSGARGCGNYLTTIDIWEFDPSKDFGSRWRLLNTWNGGPAETWVNNNASGNNYKLCTTGAGFTNAGFALGNSLYFIGGDRSMWEQGNGGWGRPFTFKWRYTGPKDSRDYIQLTPQVVGAPGPYTIPTGGSATGETSITIGSIGETFLGPGGARMDKASYLPEYYHYNSVSGVHEPVAGDQRKIIVQPYYTNQGQLIFNSYSGTDALLYEPSSSEPSFEIENVLIPENGVSWANTVDSTNQVWKYDISSNSWMRMEDFPIDGISGGLTFELNNKGYILPQSWRYNVPQNIGQMFWEFDPNAGSRGSWIKKHAFGGGTRSGSFVFLLNNKGYIGHGNGQGFGSTYTGSQTARSDLWQVDVNDSSFDDELPIASMLLPTAGAFSYLSSNMGGYQDFEFRIGASINQSASAVKYYLSRSACNKFTDPGYFSRFNEGTSKSGFFKPGTSRDSRTGMISYSNNPLSLIVVDDKGRASVDCVSTTYNLQTPWDAKPIANIESPSSVVTISANNLYQNGFDVSMRAVLNRPTEYVENYYFGTDGATCRQTGSVGATFAQGPYTNGGNIRIKSGGLRSPGLYRIYLSLQTRFTDNSWFDRSTNCPYIDVNVI